jgi:hypothetical protein
MEGNKMIFGLLSQMDDKRYSKELSIKTRGFNITLIVVGIIVVVLGTLFLVYTGLMAAVSGQSDSSGSGATEVITVCGSISLFLGVSGFMLILIAAISRRKFNHDLEADEAEYQKLRLQVIDLLEARTRN